MSIDECEYHEVDSLVQAKADYGPYYKNSLLYLACVDLKRDLTKDECMLRAHDLSVAALLGETIYNFGELVSTPKLRY